MKASVYILLCLNVVFVAVTNNALAVTNNYKTHLEKALWDFSGDAFGCEITHRVQSFGTLKLIAKPGEAITLTLQSDWLDLNNNQSLASVISPAWQAKNSLQPPTTVLNWHGVSASSQKNTAAFLEALEQGLTWQIAISTAETNYQVSSSPVATQKVANQFRICRQQLLPQPFSYLRRLDLRFASNSSHLLASHEQDLYAVYRYLQADPSIKEILIDGHADASGDHLTNLLLSKERADEVMSRLIELGVPISMIQVRHHGNRAPIASNNDVTGRELNRRVSLRLVKSATNKMAYQGASK
ncbi:OmpA family protein [Shewanella marinintestina]|uniref:MotY family protein n=1 Tax=Shewanella marinintestina TaxID=190305 RepID=UPI0020101239|nr:OmpA family protein [Shewanella marinintestina]MCL1147741.1 OmpA family protein [Shewanella marinintestina]